MKALKCKIISDMEILMANLKTGSKFGRRMYIQAFSYKKLNQLITKTELTRVNDKVNKQ